VPFKAVSPYDAQEILAGSGGLFTSDKATIEPGKPTFARLVVRAAVIRVAVFRHRAN